MQLKGRNIGYEGSDSQKSFHIIETMKQDKDFMQGVKDDKSPGVLRQLKNQIKYGRTNAIHETPVQTYLKWLAETSSFFSV